MELSLHNIGFGWLNVIRLFFGLANEFGDAWRAAEVIRSAADNPSAFAVGFGSCDRAKPVAWLRSEVVLGAEATELFRRELAAIGCDIRERIGAPGRQIEISFFRIGDLRWHAESPLFERRVPPDALSNKPHEQQTNRGRDQST